MKHLLLALGAIATVAACNVSTEGAHGNIAFTPSECGRIGCDFDDSIGVGGTIEMHIEGLDGVSTVGTTIISEDPELLSAVAIADVGGRPTWELLALNAGVARLTVLTQGEEVLDFIEVPIQELSGLIAQNVVGDAIGPAEDASYDEVWTVNADQAVSFQLTPVIGLDAPTMGKYVYTATIDQGMEEGLIDQDLSEGYLYFNVPAGEYLASFEDDFGHTFDMLIVAE